MLGTLFGAFSLHQSGCFQRLRFADGISSMGGQLWVQFLGVVSVVAFTALATWAIVKLVGLLTGGLKVTARAGDRRTRSCQP